MRAREGVDQDVQSLLVVKATQEQHVRIVAQERRGAPEASGCLGHRQFLEEDAVGDHFLRGTTRQRRHALNLVRVECMDEPGSVEDVRAHPGTKGDLLLEPTLGHAPGVEHAVGGDDPWDASPPCRTGGSLQDRIPHAVEVQEIHAFQVRLEPAAGTLRAQAFGLRPWFEQVQRLRARLGCRRDHRLDPPPGLLRGVPEDLDLMPALTLRRPQSCGHHRWAAVGGVEGRDDVYKPHAVEHPGTKCLLTTVRLRSAVDGHGSKLVILLARSVPLRAVSRPCGSRR